MPRGRSAVGRTSTFGAARTIAIILLADLLPGIKADPDPWAECWIEFIHPARGVLHCYHLSAAARAGIYLGLFVLFLALFYVLALIFSLVTYRRRRAPQTNQQHQPNDESAYNGHDGLPPYVHQYPLQAQGVPGDVLDYAYDPNARVAPPAGSPPQYHPPPPGAPLVEHHKGPYHV
ncbi:hypothetical protein EDB84DRAFT_1516373 [Lactarius hengduanensis]|nr:hypothetical protein EDB84DRAFT_1516373 [Lactarius hengduanensis]